MAAKKNEVEMTQPAAEDNILTLYSRREKEGGLRLAGGEELPAFMREDAEIAKQQARDMAAFVTPPRAKIVQPQTQGEVADHFAAGDVVILPQMIEVMRIGIDSKQRPREQSDVFHIVPIGFWAEWIKWAPRELKDKYGSIVEMSQEFDSPLAIKSRDPKSRFEPIPGETDKDGKQLGFNIVEHLNFMVITLDVEAAHGVPFILSFCKAEHKIGRNLSSMIRARKAPSYGSIFACRSALRKNDKGKWYGVDVMNPAEGVPRFVKDESLYGMFKNLYIQTKELVDSRRIKVDHDEDEVVNGEVVSDGPKSSDF